jgi:hypothetical protein
LDCVGSFAIDLATKQGRNKRMYKIIGADQKEYGPVSAEEMRRWIAEGRVNAQTLVQGEGQTDWRPLSTFPELATVAQPMPGSAPMPATPNIGAAQLVSGPATALLVVGILCAVAAVLSMLSNMLGMGAGAGGAQNMPPQLQQWVEMTSGGVGIFLNLLGLAVSGFIIFASVKMRKLESYGLVMAATIISMVPCLSPCCCVGLPVGIWILVVLCKPEVKSSFH